MRPLTLAAALLIASAAYAQDNLILRNGGEIPVKVLEVNPNDLKYRKADNPDGPVYTAPLRDVLMIKYVNGTKDVFGNQPMPATAPRLSDGERQRRRSMTSDAAAGGLATLRYRSRFLNKSFVGSNGQRLSLNETESVLRLQPDALTAFDRGRSLRTWSLVTAGSAVALVGVGAGIAISGRWSGFDGRGRGFNGPGNDPFLNDQRPGGRRDSQHVGAALAGGGLVLGLASVWLGHRATVQFRRAANRYNQRPATSLQLSPGSSGLGMGLALRF